MRSSSVREAGRGTEAGFAGGPCTAATVSPAVGRERETHGLNNDIMVSESVSE